MVEHLLMADVRPPDGDLEAEPVKVRATPDAVELVLHDGTVLTLDPHELVAAVASAVGGRAAA